MNSQFIEKVKSYLISNFDNADSTFHKTKENCPNFHRVIGDKESSKYVLKSIVMITIFFLGIEIRKNWIYLIIFILNGD